MSSRASKIVKKRVPQTHKSLERRKIISKMGTTCHWCGIHTDNSIYNDNSPRATTIDHIRNTLDQRRRDGDNSVVVACWACNQLRSKIHLMIFGRMHTVINGQLHVHEPEILPQIPQPILVPSIPLKGPRIIVDVPLTRSQKAKLWLRRFFHHIKARHFPRFWKCSCGKWSFLWYTRITRVGASKMSDYLCNDCQQKT